MQKMTVNLLTHEGLRQMKIVGDTQIDPGRYLQYLPLQARDRVVVTPAHDELLGLFSLELMYPVYEPYDFFIYGPKKFRRLMVIHNCYARRVSECIALAAHEFSARTSFSPIYAFVQSLPNGAENGMDVHGCILFAAEWMPANCVATGGCDVG